MQEEPIRSLVAAELGLTREQVSQTAALLDAGNTIPFIARYRKEVTGELNEEQLRQVADRLDYLRNLEKRKDEIIRLIDEQGKLTDEVEKAARAAVSLAEAEDVYRPFRPKRRTRATLARERGLEPLAAKLLDADNTALPADLAAAFMNPEFGIETPEAALAGARDIIAELIADDAAVRRFARNATVSDGIIVSTRTEADGEQAGEFEMYFDFRQPILKLPAHRVLALNRGQRLDVLKVKIEGPDARIVAWVQKRWVPNAAAPAAAEVALAAADSYRRLIGPAIEREVRAQLTERAEAQAVQVFADNLHQLLMQPPVRGHTVMGIDPGFRTGCKVAVADATGKILAVATVHITLGTGRARAAGEAILLDLITEHHVTLIAIGNGTASRETEEVIAAIMPNAGPLPRYTIVSEAGASVYSASKLAAAEFPQYDVSLRGAISIARRLQDPLAELVKIESRSIGVGQYQHDVDQKRLAEQLAIVVESAVNAVGVDLNTASASLLQYVAGIKPAVAANIVEHRELRGPFQTRHELRQVTGMGEKTFTQCAGFLRIHAGSEPLDHTAVHPESYDIARDILAAVQYSPGALSAEEHSQAPVREALARLDPVALASNLAVGLPTVRDIIAALQKPGRDPRDDLPAPNFRTDIINIKDLQPGMELSGTVRNVVDFGVFVDIGVHQDGLVHISELSHTFIQHPSQAVAVGDLVRVWVLAVDLRRNRISLTMKGR